MPIHLDSGHESSLLKKASIGADNCDSLGEVGEEQAMRGRDRRGGELFSYVGIETRLRSDHPLRAVRWLVDEALEVLNPAFAAIYVEGTGRPSIPPERLLRAMLLQAFYSARSERQLLERLEFDLLFRWFVGLRRMSLPGMPRHSRRTATVC